MAGKTKAAAAERVRTDEPVYRVQAIPIEQVEANNYNPNAVARNEMRLLYISIKEDGYTQPVVCIYDAERDKYIIIDGFHRYSVMRHYDDIRERCNGLLPCVVLNKDLGERMAATVRHNRARGKHSVVGMGNIVYNLLEEGWDDKEICNRLGLEADELMRLKHITGFSKLFEDVQYRKSWETKNQIKLRTAMQNGTQEDQAPAQPNPTVPKKRARH